ncbi:hypothetical protein [Microbacterium oleivorans]|uniref:hypothetical protein n=1 Tax=Microbacterium TaxID=33882 RepID=UPI00203A948C|nr:hypothetical protein [Microbacterium oleivorans]MCM3697504.1 hypothetical protein [Microbacterium oleivorans]
MATHDSPKGRPVEIVSGNGDDVRDRGQQIINLGAAMGDAESLLTRLVDDGAEMEGQAVDKLREVSGEVNVELRKAAELYQAVGPYVRSYGSTLASVKSRMNTIVPDADSHWLSYQHALSEWQSARMAPVPETSGDDDGDAQAAQTAHEDAVSTAEGDKDAAYALWKDAADDFDHQYDLWETAFDEAVAGIRSSTADAIEDDWRDNLDGFVDFALDVLAVAGIVLAVLAMVVGGPIVGLLALAVGVLTLAGTLWQYSRGDANGWDVALAVLGVIPFGAIGEFASGGFGAGMRAWAGFPRGGLSLGDDFTRWGLNLTARNPAQWVSDMRGLAPEAGYVANSFDDIISTAVSGQDPFMWEVIGELGTMPQQFVYAMGSAGTNLNNWATIAGGIQGSWEFGTGLDRIVYPTW